MQGSERVSPKNRFRQSLTRLSRLARQVHLYLSKHFTIKEVVWLSLAFHLLAIPSDPDMIFDEGWYVPAAKLTMLGTPYNWEHTPLWKVITGFSIKAFGDYWFAWRLPTVIVSVLAIYVFYKLAQNFMNDQYALVASIFLSLDTIFFVHGSMFLLDMPAILFGFMGLAFYFKKRYYLMSIALGISFLMKETGLFFALIILFMFVINYKRLRFNPKVAAITLLLFLGITLGGLWTYDIVFKPPDISNPISHLIAQYNAFTGVLPMLKTPPSEIRQPWTWIQPLGGNPFNANQYITWTLPPMFLSDGRMVAFWRSQVSLPIAYSCLPVLCFCLYWLFKKKATSFEGFYMIWLLITFLPWNIRALITPMKWNYYFIYTIPIICLGIGYVYSRTNSKYKTAFLGLHIVAAITFFIAFYPILL